MRTLGSLAGVREVWSLQWYQSGCAASLQDSCACCRWVAIVDTSCAWRVWSLGVFVPWWHGWRWTRWQWSSPCGGQVQASPGVVLFVIFGAFECVCIAKAEIACMWCGLHRCRVSRLRQWDFVCPRGSDGLLCFPVSGVLSQMMVW
ncbi:hypothetical protein Taro_026125 [Colocasia esculenta]|uniref:Uncharacterized protein n=1 Tax=Colocasia esculenta TaxID=4460 RepID=A0A843V5E7_COLES|nr:hypothetical protein [Colocasia esculenta]